MAKKKALPTKPKTRDLSRLTKKQKLELLDAVEKKLEIRKATRPPYSPHPRQAEVHKSRADERYLFCGNGFGKSTILVNEMHFAATGYNPITKESLPVPATIYLVVDDPAKIEQTIVKEYRKWYKLEKEQLSKNGKPHVSQINYPNGSVIHILTHEVNLLKLEGVEMTHLFFDEPPPRHAYVGLKRGGRIKGRPLRILMAGTPLYQPWLRTQIYKPWTKGKLPYVECFAGNTDDNPHLAEDFKERFGEILTEEEKLTRFKGAFADLSGQALAHLFKESTHVIKRDQLDWDAAYPCCIAIDPHSSKPHHAVLLGVDRDNYLYVLEELSLKKIAREFARKMIELGWFTQYRVIDIIYDCSGNAEGTSGEGYRSFGEVLNEEFKKAGIGNARGTDFKDKNDEDFIERIRDALAIPKEPNNYGQRIPKLRVLENCPGLVSDINETQWQRDKKLNQNKNKLDISNRDFLACLKYALTTNLHIKKGKEKTYLHKKGAYGFKLNRRTLNKIKKRVNMGKS